MSDSLRPYGLKHGSPPCLSPAPRVYSNPCPLSWWCHPTISSSAAPFYFFFKFNFNFLPSIFPSIRVFSNESALCIRWPKCWSFSFSICPSNEYSRLIFFRIEWFDLLPVQGTLKSLLQHHSWKVSIFQHSAFFVVQLSHPHMTTRKKSQLGLYGPFSGNLSVWCFKIYMSHLIINLFYFGVFLLLSNCFYKLRAANRGSIRRHIDMLTVKLGSITRINVCICASLGMCACAFMTKTNRTFNNRNIHDHHHSL